MHCCLAAIRKPRSPLVQSQPILAHWGGCCAGASDQLGHADCKSSAVPLVSGGENSWWPCSNFASGNGRAVSSCTGDGVVKAAPPWGQASLV